MKLRFEVNQAEAFRRGIDCPKSINTVEVDPAKQPETVRHLISDRLHGIDVCVLNPRTHKPLVSVDGEPQRIVANAPTFEALMEAVLTDERRRLGTKEPVLQAQCTQEELDAMAKHCDETWGRQRAG